jgi:hypothetical protein
MTKGEIPMLKRMLFLFAFFILFTGICFGQNSITLDAAIKEASDYFLGQLPQNSKVAITNFTAPTINVSEYIIDSMTKYLVDSHKLSMVDRQHLDEIRNEIDFGMKGEVSDETAQRLGQIAGAEIIILGSITSVDDHYNLRIRALTVETSTIQGIFTRNIQSRDMEKMFGLNRERTPRTPSAAGAVMRRIIGFLPHRISVGSSFSTPLLVLTLYNYYNINDYMFFDYGCDFGLLHANQEIRDVNYYSFYPNLHINGNIPLDGFEIGDTWHNINIFGGLGAGYMISTYAFPQDTAHINTFAFDVGAGITISPITFGYNLRTNFKGINHKVYIGVYIPY